MLNDLAKKCFENAKEKGFYDKPQSPLERHMLIVTEIAEATEEARKGTPPLYYFDKATGATFKPDQFTPGEILDAVNRGALKPEGELIEIADAMIRMLDYCGSKGWDLEAAIKTKMDYNASREKMHGGKLY